MKSELCIYCEASVANTVDHIPPKLLLPKPYPPNLVSVPACRNCNSSFQHDDEYFRAMLTARIGVDESSLGGTVLERMLRGLRRPQARRLLAAITNSVTSRELMSKDGKPLGRMPAFDIDVPRIVRSFEHLIRGFYWKDTGRTMPRRVLFRANVELERDAEAVKLMEQILAGTTLTEVGTAFRYAWRETPDQPYFSAWLLEFYGTEQFAAFTIDPDHLPAGLNLTDL